MASLGRKVQGIEETFETTEERLKQTELKLETTAQLHDESER